MVSFSDPADLCLSLVGAGSRAELSLVAAALSLCAANSSPWCSDERQPAQTQESVEKGLVPKLRWWLLSKSSDLRCVPGGTHAESPVALPN